MVKGAVTKTTKQNNHIIKWRSHEPSRLETFSDAVFAFAVTLVIVSLEVPKSFNELHEIMNGFASFAVCFFMLFNIWNIQNTFFRRFGLKDSYTMALNAILLFVVLFYVYPLKFLFNLVFNSDITIDRTQTSSLMLIYGGGYFTIFFLFFLMYNNAIKYSQEIDLTDKELYHTKTIGYGYLINSCIGVLSCIIAISLPINLAGLSGFTYFLIGPALWV